MKEIRFEITGVTPGLMTSNPQKIKKPTGATTRGGKAAIPTPEEEAEAGCYRLPSGQIYGKSEWFRGAVLEVCRGRKYPGNKSALTLMQGTLFDEMELLPMFHPVTRKPITEYVIDTRRAVVQGAGVMRSRPFYPEWALVVRFIYDEIAMDVPKIVEAIQDAGKFVGVGEFRPRPPANIKGHGKGGPFGRFEARLLEVGEAPYTSTGQVLHRDPHYTSIGEVAQCDESTNLAGQPIGKMKVPGK